MPSAWTFWADCEIFLNCPSALCERCRGGIEKCHTRFSPMERTHLDSPDGKRWIFTCSERKMVRGRRLSGALIIVGLCQCSGARRLKLGILRRLGTRSSHQFLSMLELFSAEFRRSLYAKSIAGQAGLITDVGGHAQQHCKLANCRGRPIVCVVLPKRLCLFGVIATDLWGSSGEPAVAGTTSRPPSTSPGHPMNIEAFDTCEPSGCRQIDVERSFHDASR